MKAMAWARLKTLQIYAEIASCEDGVHVFTGYILSQKN